MIVGNIVNEFNDYYNDLVITNRSTIIDIIYTIILVRVVITVND